MGERKELESYILKQEIDVQEYLLKYLESGIIWMKQYIKEGKTLQDFLDETKKIHWAVKETHIEQALGDMSKL